MFKILFFVAFVGLFSVINASSYLQPEEDAASTAERFIRGNRSHKIGLIIGRTKEQGIAEAQVTDPRLKGTTWLYLDPENHLGGVSDIKAKWPSTDIHYTLEGKFDVVAIDRWSLFFIENTYKSQIVVPFAYMIELKIDVEQLPPGSYKKEGERYNPMDRYLSKLEAKNIGGKFYITKDSFDAPYLFQDWLNKNKPKELQDLMTDLEPRIKASQENYATVHGIKRAYEAVKPGGWLYIGEDSRIPTIENVNALAQTLGINSSLIEHEEKTIINDPSRDGDPFLPGNTKHYHGRNMSSFFIYKPKNESDIPSVAISFKPISIDLRSQQWQTTFSNVTGLGDFEPNHGYWAPGSAVDQHSAPAREVIFTTKEALSGKVRLTIEATRHLDENEAVTIRVGSQTKTIHLNQGSYAASTPVSVDVDLGDEKTNEVAIQIPHYDIVGNRKLGILFHAINIEHIAD